MKPPGISRLFDELRRRRVFKGILVYGAATLVIYEAADNLYNTFGHDAAPEWLVYVLVVGFIGSLWFSWIYDITPGGIRKTEAQMLALQELLQLARSMQLLAITSDWMKPRRIICLL